MDEAKHQSVLFQQRKLSALLAECNNRQGQESGKRLLVAKNSNKNLGREVDEAITNSTASTGQEAVL
jgi:hypothetical protein